MNHPEVTKLYKYREYSSRTLTALSNNELYYACSNSFNDPFDCRARKEFEFKDTNEFIEKWSHIEKNQQHITLEKAKIIVTEISSDENKKEEYIKRKSAYFQKLIFQSFGICSFSKKNDDLLLWSHYADSHNGLCLEFARSPDNWLEEALPVEYPNNDDFPFIDYWLNTMEEQIEEFTKIILTKSKHWAYEEEWRVAETPPDKKVNYKGHAVTYPQSMLTGVIFGYRMNEKQRSAIKTLLSGCSVKYYESTLVKNKFQLSIVPI